MNQEPRVSGLRGESVLLGCSMRGRVGQPGVQSAWTRGNRPRAEPAQKGCRVKGRKASSCGLVLCGRMGSISQVAGGTALVGEKLEAMGYRS